MTNCGFLVGVERDQERSNWSNDGPRPLAWALWYPAKPRVTQDAQRGDLPYLPLFDPGQVDFGAEPASGQHPLVLLSHGTGGTADSMGWLARRLVARGYMVLGVNHHGNTGVEKQTAEGNVCVWERMADLSALLSHFEGKQPFAAHIDFDHVMMAGFSVGGYTALGLAGAISSLTEFEAWQASIADTPILKAQGTRAYMAAASRIPKLMEQSPALVASWARHGQSYFDPRIKAVAAIAPAPPIRAFTPESVAAIQTPTLVLTAGNDHEAPAEFSDWLMAQNARFKHASLGPQVGHYSFLDLANGKPTERAAYLFEDHPSVDRAQVHDETAAYIAVFFGGT